jgi:hypothetical protein
MGQSSASDGGGRSGEGPGNCRVPEWAVFNRPCLGERVSGDDAIIEERDGMLFLAILDVLGHGKDAHDLAVRMSRYLRETWSLHPKDVLCRLHEEFKGERGAAVGAAVLDISRRELRYAGVGNTTVRRHGGDDSTLFSVDGNIGSSLRTPVEQTVLLTPDDVLIFLTDGVQGSFRVEDEPNLLLRNVHWIARTIVQRFGKSYDDATCIVLRWSR